MTTNLIELAERCEQATEAETRELLWQAHRLIYAGEGVEPGAYAAFIVLLDARGFLDAAITLVPEGCLWTLEPNTAWVRWLTAADVGEAQATGSNAALALTAASLGALSQQVKP